MAKRQNKLRNVVMQETLMQLVERQTLSRWPREVLEFQGISNLRPFEAMRRELGAPVKNLMVLPIRQRAQPPLSGLFFPK